MAKPTAKKTAEPKPKEKGKGKAAGEGHWVTIHEPDGGYHHIYLKGARGHETAGQRKANARILGGKPGPAQDARARDTAHRADFISGGQVTGRVKAHARAGREANRLRTRREAHNAGVKAGASTAHVARRVHAEQGRVREAAGAKASVREQVAAHRAQGRGTPERASKATVLRSLHKAKISHEGGVKAGESDLAHAKRGIGGRDAEVMARGTIAANRKRIADLKTVSDKVRGKASAPAPSLREQAAAHRAGRGGTPELRSELAKQVKTVRQYEMVRGGTTPRIREGIKAHLAANTPASAIAPMRKGDVRRVEKSDAKAKAVAAAESAKKASEAKRVADSETIRRNVAERTGDMRSRETRLSEAAAKASQSREQLRTDRESQKSTMLRFNKERRDTAFQQQYGTTRGAAARDIREAYRGARAGNDKELDVIDRVGRHGHRNLVMGAIDRGGARSTLRAAAAAHKHQSR